MFVFHEKRRAAVACVWAGGGGQANDPSAASVVSPRVEVNLFGVA